MFGCSGYAALATAVSPIAEIVPLRYVIVGEPGAVDLVERAQAANGVLILTKQEMELWDRCVRVLP